MNPRGEKKFNLRGKPHVKFDKSEKGGFPTATAASILLHIKRMETYAL